MKWWMWLGIGAGVLYLATKKKAQAAPAIYTPAPKQPVQQVVDAEDPMNEYSGCGCF